MIYVFDIFMSLFIVASIDINNSELQYLADHLTIEECRILITAAHFKTYEVPNALDQAVRKVDKDIKCIDLLHHWNSEKGEGKGETHEALEHRLRQMGKTELANWLGKTVFHELGEDLNRSLVHEFDITSTEGSEINAVGPTLSAVVKDEDPTEWSPMDSILTMIIIVFLLFIIIICTNACFSTLTKRRKRKSFRKVEVGQSYEPLEAEISETESEDKFDVRDYSRKNLIHK